MTDFGWLGTTSDDMADPDNWDLSAAPTGSDDAWMYDGGANNPASAEATDIQLRSLSQQDPGATSDWSGSLTLGSSTIRTTGRNIYGESIYLPSITYVTVSNIGGFQVSDDIGEIGSVTFGAQEIEGLRYDITQVGPVSVELFHSAGFRVQASFEVGAVDESTVEIVGTAPWFCDATWYITGSAGVVMHGTTVGCNTLVWSSDYQQDGAFDGSTFNVSSEITVTGNRLLSASDLDPGNAIVFNVSGMASASGCYIRNCDFSGGVPLDATDNCVDGGGNINVIFGATPAAHGMPRLGISTEIGICI